MAVTEKSAIRVLEKEVFEETKCSDSLIEEVHNVGLETLNEVIRVIFEKSKESCQKYLPNLILVNNEYLSETNQHYPVNQKQSLLTWMIDTAHGYDSAMRSGQTMVILFADQGSLAAKVKSELSRTDLQNFAQQAIFIHADPSRDETAARLSSTLKIEHPPTLCVLTPNQNAVHEVGRVGWFNNSDAVAKHLAHYIINSRSEETGAAA